MFSERTQLRLHDIVENADAAQQYLSAMSLADLQADRKTIDAIERCLQRITEAVIQIDADELTKIIPDLPTSRIRGMGNMLRHEYRRVDPKIVFDTVRNDLPSLRAACVAALESGGR